MTGGGTNERLPGADGAVVLGAFAPADVPLLTEGFADPLTAEWNPGPADGDVGAWVAARNDRSVGEHVSWAIRSGVDDTLLGSVSVFKIDLGQADGEIGYFVLPGVRGRGLAVVAVQLASAYVFGVLGLHRLQLFHAVENVASCRVATKSGFALEGSLRQSYKYADGNYHDEHLHARLVADGSAETRGARGEAAVEEEG